MIIIDGRQTEMNIANFANLEEILVTATSTEAMSNRIVTDVLLNNEQFSELYPHQAEDIENFEITKVEICSVPCTQMAIDISTELLKVTTIMQSGSRQLATLFRQSGSPETLHLFQDVIDVTRDFMAMIGVLRSEFIDKVDMEFVEHVETISNLLAQMNEVIETEDWILLADLLEFEFLPTCVGWESIIKNLRASIEQAE